jgi:hypothetical protein
MLVHDPDRVPAGLSLTLLGEAASFSAEREAGVPSSSVTTARWGASVAWQDRVPCAIRAEGNDTDNGDTGSGESGPKASLRAARGPAEAEGANYHDLPAISRWTWRTGVEYLSQDRLTVDLLGNIDVFVTYRVNSYGMDGPTLRSLYRRQSVEFTLYGGRDSAGDGFVAFRVVHPL